MSRTRKPHPKSPPVRIFEAQNRVIEAAKRWGDSDADDPVQRLAADLELAAALMNLRDAEKGQPETYPPEVFQSGGEGGAA